MGVGVRRFVDRPAGSAAMLPAGGRRGFGGFDYELVPMDSRGPLLVQCSRESGNWVGAVFAIWLTRSFAVLRPASGAPDLNVGMNLTVQKLDNELPTPGRVHADDAGIDLYAAASAQLDPGERRVIGSGIAVAIPEGFAGLVVPRSGLAARHGIGVLNAPGLIDSGYRGEIKIILVNHGNASVDITRGDRVAQLVVIPVALLEVVVVDELERSERGEGGLGSSGR